MKVQVELKGFTPLIDKLVSEYGVVVAAVYGAVWRYAQQEDGVCWASGDTIADRLNVSRRTIVRHLKVLVDNGYLVDLTPNLQGKSHHYTYTAKASISGVIETGVTESHSTCDKLSQVGVTNCHTKKQDKKQFKKHGATPAPSPEPQPPQPVINHEADWLLHNRNGHDQTEIDAISQVETVWRSRIGQDAKQAIALYVKAMAGKGLDATIPRDKSTQGKWGAGVRDHLDNYSLDELKTLYPLAIQHATERGWDIYSPQSLTTALSKVNVTGSNKRDDISADELFEQDKQFDLF